MTSKVYVRLIDGVGVFIPVEARFISHDVYQLMSDHEFDYEDDAVLFDFGSQDAVNTEEKQLGRLIILVNKNLCNINM